MPARTPVRTVVANRQLLRLLVAYAGAAIAEWALWVAVLVYAYEHGGSTAAGVAAIALLVPSVFVASWAGRAADGAKPVRVLGITFLVQAVALAVTAGLARAELPAAVVLATAGIAINAITFIRPAASVVAPGLVVSPADLVAANLLTGNADSVSVLVGPLIAGALLAIEGPATVFGACGAIAIGCAVMVWPMARRDPVMAAPDASARQAHALRDVIRTMSRTRGSVELLGVLGGQYALVGGLDLLYVNLAFGPLDLGSSGSGYLSAMFGVGAVAGGLASALLIARRRLAPLMIASLFAIGAAMLAMTAHTTLSVVLAVLGVAGVSRSLLDVTGRMLLQRCAPQDSLASTFALLEVFAGIGIVFGSLLVQLLIAVDGVRAATLGLGVLFVVACVATAPGLRHADEHADAPVVEIRLLRSVPLFAPLPGPELEQLARTSVSMAFDDGDVVVAEGAIGDRYYVVADGEVEVTMSGRHVRTMTRGQGFGEIALLAGVPRTAAVTARSRVTLLAIDRVNFLETVAGHDASARVAWNVARTWHPTLDDDGP